MNCDVARELIGLGSELAAADRVEMERHVASCAACAVVAADEAAMRALLAARAVPAFAEAQRTFLMQAPPPGLTAAIWRARTATWAPISTLAILLVLGVRLLDRGQDTPAAVPPAGPHPAAPTQVARLAPVRVAPPAHVRTGPQPERPPVPASAPPAELVFVVEPAPDADVPTIPETISPADGSTGSSDSRGDGGRSGGNTAVPGRSAPIATAVPTVETWLDLTVQALTDLAGGSADCPGCDGITPADGQAAPGRPVGRVSVRLWALSDDSGRLDLGMLSLEPANAGLALATVRVPEAAAYAIEFADAEGGFALCPAAESQVIVRPGEGGLFAAFRLWTGCPAAPPN